MIRVILVVLAASSSYRVEVLHLFARSQVFATGAWVMYIHFETEAIRLPSCGRIVFPEDSEDVT